MKYNTNLDLVYYTFSNPGKGVEVAQERNFLFLSLFMGAFSMLSSFTGDNLILSKTTISGSLSMSFFIKLFLFYFFLFAVTLIYNSIVEFSGRKQKVTVLLALFGFSFLPLIFKTPLALICKGFSLEGFYFLLKVMIIVWTTGLQIFFLRKLYDFSLFRTIIVYISPLLLMGSLIFSFILIFLIFLALDLGRMII